MAVNEIYPTIVDEEEKEEEEKEEHIIAEIEREKQQPRTILTPLEEPTPTHIKTFFNIKAIKSLYELPFQYEPGLTEKQSTLMKKLAEEIYILKRKINELDEIQNKLREIDRKFVSYSKMLNSIDAIGKEVININKEIELQRKAIANLENNISKQRNLKEVGVISGNIIGSFILIAIGLFTNLIFYSIIGILLFALTVYHAMEKR